MRIVRNEYTDYEWIRGNLSWMLRPHGQTWIHDFILDCTPIGDTVEPVVVNAHRRLGKSFLNVLMGIERCLSAPNQLVKYVCGEKEQVRDIVEPLLLQILESCPAEIYPKQRGLSWVFQNPHWPHKGRSYLKLVWANYKRGNMGRGTACDAAFLDEVRDFNNLRYFVEAVLLYQFVGRDNPLLVVTSTVPWTMDHDFTRPGSGYIAQAMAKGRYICLPASENPDFTARDKKLILATIPGGETDHSYLREAECQLIGDVARLITPEYQEHRSACVVEDYPDPEIFVPWVVMDSGFDPDCTAILWGYLDWLAQLLVFKREVVRRRMTTREIAEAVVAGTRELGWDQCEYKVKYAADIEERGLADLRRDHGLSFSPAVKHHAESALATLRTRIAAEQVRVCLKGCPQLDYQLLHGIWNERGTDFERSDSMGHWDAGKAAVYLNRLINWKWNPYPANWHLRKGLFPTGPAGGNLSVAEGQWDDVCLRALNRPTR